MAPSGEDLSQRKRALRLEMAERRAALPDDAQRERSRVAVARLLALPEMAAIDRAGTIAGYVAVRGEIDPAAALARVVEGQGRLALPRVSRGVPRLRLHRVVPGMPLAMGRFDLREPPETAEEIAIDAVDVMIVPGLAFDGAGRRLGFGGGYYDELLAGVPAGDRPALIGLAYDFQIVARCPADARDVSVDLVVTEARLLRPAAEVAP